MSKQYKMDKAQNKIVEVKPEEEVEASVVVEDDGISTLDTTDEAVTAPVKLMNAEELSARCVQDNKVAAVYAAAKLPLKRTKDTEFLTYYSDGRVVAKWSLKEGRWVITPGQASV